jgi:hypothetical protein
MISFALNDIAQTRVDLCSLEGIQVTAGTIGVVVSTEVGNDGETMLQINKDTRANFRPEELRKIGHVQ